MLVLHLGVIDEHLALWGESSLGADPGAETHPFAATPQALAEALAVVGLRPGSPVDMWVWLPTQGARPVPSSPLLDPDGPDVDLDNEATTLTSWRIPAQRLSAADVEVLLSEAAGRRMLAPGVLIGDDMAFWAHVLHFAAGLVAREQVLPGLAPTPGGWQARWEAVVLGDDADRLARLADAMPHACRALSAEPGAAPSAPPLALLRDRLNAFVDPLVRESVAEPRLTKPVTPAFDSVHDRWLYALRALDGRMDTHGPESSPDALDDLADAIRLWRRRLAVTTEAPFRLAFRLESPDPAGPETWTVRALLQATDDPSLLIDVADAWAPDKATAALFARRGVDAREHLLASLGQAMSLFPALEASLQAPDATAWGHVEMDTEHVYGFLTETAWLLQQAGFGVRLPSWWARRGARRLTAGATVRSPTMQAAAGLSMATLVDVDWHAILGDERISHEELEALATRKVPLVQFRGEWIEVDAEAIRAALDSWATPTTLTARDAVRLAIGLDGGDGIPVETVEATGWMGDLLASLGDAGRIATLPAPAGFEGTLRPYQERGTSWMAFLQTWGLGACLADDMGLGKTVQTLALIQHNIEAGQKKPVLLVCPTSVLGNWQREAARFTPGLPVLVHHGTRRTKAPADFKKEVKAQALVITSYALLHRDLDALKAVRWQAVVLDEAQNVKNPRTKQAQAVRALNSEHRIALTGTPVENHVGDLWALMDVLNPGLLGTQASFKREFFAPIQAGADDGAAEDAARRLKRLTQPFILRRLKTDRSIIDDLPEKLEMEVFTTLTKEQASLYRAVVKEAEAALDDAEGIARRGLVLATLTKLKQVCNHPAQLLHDGSAVAGRSGKLARLTEMLDEVLASGERALLFTQFTEMGEIVRRHLHETFGREVAYLHGGVGRAARDAMVERFQTDPDGPPFFVLSLKAGGTGLTLTRANHVFHIDRWWNPAVEDQATDRAFRIGQTRAVQVHKFVSLGTVEERVHEMIERKKAVAEQVVGTGESWLTELSTRDLKALFRLSRDAVRE